jgi:hypothetical protein
MLTPIFASIKILQSSLVTTIFFAIVTKLTDCDYKTFAFMSTLSKLNLELDDGIDVEIIVGIMLEYMLSLLVSL